MSELTTSVSGTDGVAGPNVHLNLWVRGRPASATVSMNERCQAVIAGGRGDVIRCGLGQSPFPVPEPVVAALREHAHRKDYLPVGGLPELRAAVAAYHQQKDGIPCVAEDVLVGPGSKELMFLLQLVYYGDLVIPSPSWVSYAPQARMLGRRVARIPTSPENGWLPMAEDLARHCAQDPGRPRIVVLNYPSNPTGASYEGPQLEAIASVAREHRILLLSDEIYGQLHFRAAHESIATYYPEGTIVSGGLSKWCGAGGWRLGTFVFPPGLRWLQNAMAAAASETYTSTSAPIQYAAVEAFRGGPFIDTYLRRSRKILARLAHTVVEALIASDISCVRPVGAFYVFPNFGRDQAVLGAAGIRNSIDLAERLLEDTGVAGIPGVEFGRPRDELTMRLALVDFDGARALEAAGDGSLPESFLEEHCANMLEAVARIRGWIRCLRSGEPPADDRAWHDHPDPPGVAVGSAVPAGSPSSS